MQVWIPLTFGDDYVVSFILRNEVGMLDRCKDSTYILLELFEKKKKINAKHSRVYKSHSPSVVGNRRFL